MPADATLCQGFYFHRDRFRCAKCRVEANLRRREDSQAELTCPGCHRQAVLPVSRATPDRYRQFGDGYVLDESGLDATAIPKCAPLDLPAKALTVWQPYATLLVMGVKPVENRTWPTKFRGRLAIHAGKQMQIGDYTSARDYLQSISPADAARLPAFIDLPRGAVVGSVELWDCRRSPDRLQELADFETPDGWSWHCRLPVQHQPIPWRGAQGIWPIKSALTQRIREVVRK